MSLWGEFIRLGQRPVLRAFAIVVLLTISSRMEPVTSTIYDPDVWWHLRDGYWMAVHHAVPHVGLFAQHAESRPWVAYSWGFELVLAAFHRCFGLLGMVILRTLMETAIAVSLFVLIRRRLTFWPAWALTGVGMWAMHHCFGPQPTLFSIFFFVLELGLIFEALQTSSARPLYWIPPLFLIWANSHIQFIYGMFILTLFAAMSWIGAVASRHRWFSINLDHDPPARTLIAILGLSFVATLIGPYSFRLYQVIFTYVHSTATYALIIEHWALGFREMGDYILLLLTGGAFFALGWRRSLHPFKIALLIACTIVGFRMARDSWFVCVPAVFVICDAAQKSSDAVLSKRRIGFALGTAAATIAIFELIALDSRINNPNLAFLLRANFPVDACAFVRSHSYPGPIYNDMNWGGFLIWDLPEYPVAVDGRTDLYGDDLIARSYRVQQGSSEWISDRDLNAANLVLVEQKVQLARELSHDPRFRPVYADPLAVVFVRNSQ